MSFNVIQVSHEHTSPKFAKAFAQGCGGRVVDQYEGGVWAGFGSPTHWGEFQEAAKNNDFYYGDHGYFGRGKYYKITKNALQHSGRGESNGIRFSNFGIPVEPWKNGRDILICPQTDAYHRMHGSSQNGWMTQVAAEVHKYTDRPLKFRFKGDKEDYHAALRDVHCVIVFTSAAAIHAILHGIPAICLGDCAASMMSLNSISDIENLYKPDNRLQWAGVLADNQWTLEEMARGKAWRMLNETV